MYFLFCDRVIKDVCVDIGLSYRDAVVFLWMYYINKFIFRTEFFIVFRTHTLFQRLNLDVKAPLTAMYRVLADLHERGFINRLGEHYLLDHTAGGLLKRFTNKFNERVGDFEYAINNPDTKQIFPKIKDKYYKPRKRKKHYVKKKR